MKSSTRATLTGPSARFALSQIERFRATDGNGQRASTGCRASLFHNADLCNPLGGQRSARQRARALNLDLMGETLVDDDDIG